MQAPVPDSGTSAAVVTFPLLRTTHERGDDSMARSLLLVRLAFCVGLGLAVIGLAAFSGPGANVESGPAPPAPPSGFLP